MAAANFPKLLVFLSLIDHSANPEIWKKRDTKILAHKQEINRKPDGTVGTASNPDFIPQAKASRRIASALGARSMALNCHIKLLWRSQTWWQIDCDLAQSFLSTSLMLETSILWYYVSFDLILLFNPPCPYSATSIWQPFEEYASCSFIPYLTDLGRFALFICCFHHTFSRW